MDREILQRDLFGGPSIVDMINELNGMGIDVTFTAKGRIHVYHRPSLEGISYPVSVDLREVYEICKNRKWVASK